jgi:hypothetical protein
MEEVRVRSADLTTVPSLLNTCSILPDPLRDQFLLFSERINTVDRTIAMLVTI